jgi:transposase InsO family protein
MALHIEDLADPARSRKEGKAGLIDRTSRPRRFHRPVSQVRSCQVVRLRRQRFTGWQIARTLGMPRSTVAAVLRRVFRAHGITRIERVMTRPYHPETNGKAERFTQTLQGMLSPLHRLRLAA